MLAKSPIPLHLPVVRRQTGDIFGELSEIIDEADEGSSIPDSAEEVGAPWQMTWDPQKSDTSSAVCSFIQL